MPILPTIFLLLGLLFLPGASQLLLTGVQRLLHKRHPWSAFFILAVGTALPELILGIFCSVTHIPQLILSTVIASSLINILIVLPFLSFSTPVVFKGETKMATLLLIVSAVFVLLTSDTSLQGGTVDLLSRGDGLILLLMLPIVFMLLPTQQVATNATTEASSTLTRRKAILLIVAGLVLIPVAGWLAVAGATDLIHYFDLPADKMGILVIAFITALPEITIVWKSRTNTEFRAGLHTELILSSVLNIVLVLGVVALLGNIAAYPYMSVDSLYLIAGAFALLLFVVIGKGWQIERHEGIIMMFLYLCFFAYVLFREDVIHLF